MRYLLLYLLSLSLLSPATGQNISNATLTKYKALNDAEPRLSDYKDNDDLLLLKLVQVEKINAYREKFKVQPLQLDIFASRVANKMAKESASHGYISHWNMAGEKPYHRYAFAGGYDHISENAYVRQSSGPVSQSLSTTAELMEYGLDNFMSEKAPYDGHKQNIIAPAHNHVGLGVHTTGNQFSYYEEYIDRYLSFHAVPAVVKPKEDFSISLSTAPGQYLHFLSVYYEPFPKAMTPAQLNRTNSYPDFTDTRVENRPPWELSEGREGRKYNIPFRFDKPGLYYLKIYISDKDITEPQAVGTQGYDQASGIVVRVEK